MTTAREMAVAVEQAVNTAIRNAYNRPPYHSEPLVSIMPKTAMGGLMRRMLRVEITRDVMYDVIHSADYQSRGELMPKEGPRKLHGVDLYVVDELPAPGWRIVDPLA